MMNRLFQAIRTGVTQTADHGARSLFTSRPLHLLPRDSGIGVAGGGESLGQHPPIWGETNVTRVAGHRQYAIDLPVRKVICALDPDQQSAFSMTYEKARATVQKDAKNRPDDTHSSSMARQLLLVPCERNQLFGKYAKVRVYSEYSRSLARTTFERDGILNVHLGYMCMIEHFRAIAAGAVHNDGKSPVSLMSHASTSDLTAAGLSITSAEVMDFTVGDFGSVIDDEQASRDAKGYDVPAVVFTSPNDEVLDTQTFLDAHAKAFEATISPENLDRFKTAGKFTPAAKEAVEALQQLLRGTTAALPTGKELELDRTLGQQDQRHRWKTDRI